MVKLMGVLIVWDNKKQFVPSKRVGGFGAPHTITTRVVKVLDVHPAGAPHFILEEKLLLRAL